VEVPERETGRRARGGAREAAEVPHIAAQADVLSDLITAHLEAQTYECLLSHDSVKLTPPKVEEIGKRRSAA